jgi:hypothetical protein
VVVLVPLLTVVVPAASVVITVSPTGKSSTGSGCGSDTENPASNKCNTSNFGPHGSIFLSMNDRRVQSRTLIHLYELGQMEEIDQLRKLKQQWVP